MQRYRVNYGLLIGLVAGVAVIGGGLFAMYTYQRSRNATTLITQADDAGEDLRKVRTYLSQYMALRPDDIEVQERLTRVALDISKMSDASPTERGAGYFALETFIRTQPDHKDLRRELIDLLMAGRRWKDALTHINYLVNEEPKNGELQGMRLACMTQAGQVAEAIRLGYKLIGYDPVAEEFKPEKAATPNEPTVYRRLAAAVRQDRGDPEVADMIMDRLIEVNPELPTAYVARAEHRMALGDNEGGEADLDKALELDPKKVDALLLKARTVMSRPAPEDDGENTANLDAAYDLLQTAADADATDMRVYQTLAQLEVKRGDVEAAIAHYDQGIKSVNKRLAPQLAFMKASQLIESGKIDEAKEAIVWLQDNKIRQEFVDYLLARIMVVENKWFAASQELARLSPAFQGQLAMWSELNISLALCYERIQQYDAALQTYQSVLEVIPGNPFVKAGVARMEQLLGKKSNGQGQNQINSLIARELRKPEAEQNWGPIFATIDEFVSQPLVAPGSGDLIKAEIYMRRGMSKDAEKAVRRALKENEDNLRAWQIALRIIASDADKGPEAALARMPKLFERFGDTAALRLMKADFLISSAPEDLTEQLMEIAEGIDSWDPIQQSALWKGLATRFAQLRDPESRRICLANVVGLTPDDLPTLLEIYQTAIDGRDAEGIETAQADILRLVGSKDNPTYLYTEANRLLWIFATKQGDLNDLDRADRLIERALLKRPDWHKLYQLQALVSTARGDKDAAIVAFGKGHKRGRLEARPLLVYVSMLLERNRYRDAADALEPYSADVRQRLLGRTYAEILLNTGKVQDAISSADIIAANRPEDGATQLWYGRFLLQATRSPTLDDAKRTAMRERAENALDLAVELTPEDREAWLAQIGLLIESGDRLAAQAVLRKAQLALPEDEQPLLVARCYEWLGRWFDAETIYKREYERNPDNRALVRSLAAFYLGPRYPRPDKRAKATPLLNELLRSAEKADFPPNEPTVLWARRTAAEMLARSKDYQQLRDAERLLTSNAIDGQLIEADRLLLARILAGRPEPQSRVKAIRLLEQIQNAHVLESADDLRLGQLYFATNDWEACRRQMDSAIARNPKLPLLRESYIQMLLARGTSSDVDRAASQVDRLQKIAPTSATTLQLIVQVASKAGEQKKATRALAALLPRDPSTAPPKQLVMLGQLFTQLGALDRAEALYRAAVKQDEAMTPYLADFLGSHRDIEQAYALLEEAAKSQNLPIVIRTMLVINSARRDEVGDKYDDRIQKLFDRALREDPLSVQYQMQLAEFRDSQRRFDDAAAIYRRLLDLPELEGTSRAVVLNNLAYLLALAARDSTEAEEALGFVAEATDILGPQADILDTQAVVHIAMGNYPAAIADLELALTDNPTASKYFHLARAHMLAGQVERAMEAWDKAFQLGLSRDSVNSAEQEQFDELRKQIEGVSPSAAG